MSVSNYSLGSKPPITPSSETTSSTSTFPSSEDGKITELFATTLGSSSSIPETTFKDNVDTIKAISTIKVLEAIAAKIKASPPELSSTMKYDELSDYSNKWLDKNSIAILDIKNLDLSGKALEYLPDSIEKLKNLTILNLQNNKITSLPNSIGKLTNLRILCLCFNKLESVPTSIKQLVNLTHLYLERNKLKSLPDDIFDDMTELTTVHLKFNEFRKPPTAIIELAMKLKSEINENCLLEERKIQYDDLANDCTIL
ncbi:MAG: hypothetical protein KR126chlam5_01481 [Candidatus Anoxychlamydiales bacterium]|nr:hypothetical protein [Candidatus Anoxychlamydiales bacterium]